jgi:hypothetical protein
MNYNNVAFGQIGGSYGGGFSIFNAVDIEAKLNLVINNVSDKRYFILKRDCEVYIGEKN